MGAVAPLIVVKHVDHHRFPGRLRLCHSALAPGVVAAGHDVQDLAKQLNLIVNTLLINKMQLTHGVGGCEKIAIAFLKSPVPGPVGALAPARRAPRPPRAGQRAGAVGSFSATDTVSWRSCSEHERRPASSDFRWPAAGLRPERPHHSAAAS